MTHLSLHLEFSFLVARDANHYKDEFRGVLILELATASNTA